jgi:hypothetical protein
MKIETTVKHRITLSGSEPFVWTKTDGRFADEDFTVDRIEITHQPSTNLYLVGPWVETPAAAVGSPHADHGWQYIYLPGERDLLESLPETVRDALRACGVSSDE